MESSTVQTKEDLSLLIPQFLAVAQKRPLHPTHGSGNE